MIKNDVVVTTLANELVYYLQDGKLLFNQDECPEDTLIIPLAQAELAIQASPDIQKQIALFKNAHYKVHSKGTYLVKIGDALQEVTSCDNIYTYEEALALLLERERTTGDASDWEITQDTVDVEEEEELGFAIDRNGDVWTPYGGSYHWEWHHQVESELYKLALLVNKRDITRMPHQGEDLVTFYPLGSNEANDVLNTLAACCPDTMTRKELTEKLIMRYRGYHLDPKRA